MSRTPVTSEISGIGAEIEPIEAVIKEAVAMFALGRAYSSDLRFKRETSGHTTIDQTRWFGRPDSKQTSIRKTHNGEISYELCARPHVDDSDVNIDEATTVLARASSSEEKLIIYDAAMSDKAVQQEFERIGAIVQADYRALEASKQLGPLSLTSQLAV